MDKLREIEDSLKRLHEEFNEQVVTLSTDTKEFHNSLINLVAKYPEHKELIQFIVFVNDKLESNQYMFSEVIVEAFNDLVDSKRALVKEVIITRQSKSCFERLKGAFKKADVKIIVIGLVIIVVSLGILADVTFADKLATLIGKIVGAS